MVSRFISLLSFGSLILTSGCAYVIDRTTQPLTIETIGAENAHCFVIADGVKHRMFPPETINISKSMDDLVVDCTAPGNRSQSVVIPSKVSTTTYANVTNGVVPGAAWDLASGAMFTYPERIIVDFTHITRSPNKLPDHNSPDIVQPEAYDLEEFKSSEPRLNSDRGRKNIPIKRRGGESVIESDLSSGYIGAGTDEFGKGGVYSGSQPTTLYPPGQ